MIFTLSTDPAKTPKAPTEVKPSKPTDEDVLENVPKNVPDIVPKRQKSPEREIDAQKEDNVLNMESIKIDTENKEAKIDVKEDKIPQVCSQNSIFLTKLLRFL